jgi:hypothetical protein
MKPERTTTIPPGCCVELAAETIGIFSWIPRDRGFCRIVEGYGLANPWPVLRPSAENKYGVLPWDIPIPANYEPDGEWEPKEGERAAFRFPVEGDCYISDSGRQWIAETDHTREKGDTPRLCVRRIKTKRTVVEVELCLDVKPFDVGNKITIGAMSGESYFGTITAVREVEQ